MHTYPIFLFCLFCLWSSPVEQLIKSEVLMTTTYHLLQWLSQYLLYFKGLCQYFIQFLCQTKNNSIERMIKIKEMVTKFSVKPKSQNTDFLYCTGL